MSSIDRRSALACLAASAASIWATAWLRPSTAHAVRPPERTFHTLALPPRAADAETGSEFFTRVEELGLAEYEDAVFEAVSGGNIPTFERTLSRVTIRGDSMTAVLYVTCDYLAIGSDEDFLRVPMTPATAERICKLTSTSLPTSKIVDEIHRAATAKLSPVAMQAPEDPRSRRDFLQHQRVIEAQRKERQEPLGALTSGIKKDIILSAELASRTDRVAIYGWHKQDGTPIQPVSTLHEKRYLDYSHGVRLVSEQVEIDGVEHRLDDVLRDPEFASIVSNEGALPLTEYPS